MIQFDNLNTKTADLKEDKTLRKLAHINRTNKQHESIVLSDNNNSFNGISNSRLLLANNPNQPIQKSTPISNDHLSNDQTFKAKTNSIPTENILINNSRVNKLSTQYLSENYNANISQVASKGLKASTVELKGSKIQSESDFKK